MSFPSGTGVLTPEELDTLQRIYSEISSEQWFTRSEERRQQFALVVLDAYRQGFTEPFALAAYCRDIAQHEYDNAAQFPEGVVSASREIRAQLTHTAPNVARRDSAHPQRTDD